MDTQLTLGLGVIHAEKGEVRAFLPDFVLRLSRVYGRILLEEGYGATMGITPESYSKPTNVSFAPAEEIYNCDFVLVLRYPPEKYLEMMPPGSCLVSMCHFPTRPSRREYLRSRDIEAISLDMIIDDNSRRLVENLRSVAWNGCEIAFQVLHKITPQPGLASPYRSPINITLLGSGGVGMHAVQAGIRYVNPQLWQTYAAQNIPGNIVRVIDYDLSHHETEVKALLRDSQMLIDATLRKNQSEIIIPNRFLGLMPENAVILDLSVDPYDFHNRPYGVKGIEGIPQGNLDQYIFSPGDLAWDALPDPIATNHRRWVVSCYSWPGIHPRSCMLLYGNQIAPLLRRIATAGGKDGINAGGRYHDRAIARGMLKYWGEE